MRRTRAIIAVVPVTLSVGLLAASAALAQGPSQTRLSLCSIYLGEPRQPCTHGPVGGATAPFDAQYRLVVRALPRLPRGDSIRIIGRQVEPVSRHLGTLRECFSTPCSTVVSAPRRGGIVVAEYFAILVRSGVPRPKTRSNTIRDGWLTTRTWSGTWRVQGASYSGKYVLTQSGKKVEGTCDWLGGCKVTGTLSGDGLAWTGRSVPNDPKLSTSNFAFTMDSGENAFSGGGTTAGGTSWRETARCIAGPCLKNG